MKVSREQLQDSFDIIQNVIVGVYQFEDEFKEKLLHNIGWSEDVFDIQRLHIATQTRITVRNTDWQEKDVYLDTQKVLDWWLNKQDELLGE